MDELVIHAVTANLDLGSAGPYVLRARVRELDARGCRGYGSAKREHMTPIIGTGAPPDQRAVPTQHRWGAPMHDRGPNAPTAVFLDVECLTGWLKGGAAERVLLDELGTRHALVVRRAYGNFSLPCIASRQALLNRLGFELVHVYHPVRGKNAADIQIAVDAMDFAARRLDVSCFVLGTGDSDFSPLFRRLREMGRDVIGVGPGNALHDAVRTSCSRYIVIDEPEPAPVPAQPEPRPPPHHPPAQPYEALMNRVLSAHPDEITLSTLKVEMLAIDASFDEAALGYKRFISFVRDRPGAACLRKGGKSGWMVSAVPRPAEVHSPPSPPPPESLVDELSERRRERLQLVFDALA